MAARAVLRNREERTIARIEETCAIDIVRSGCGRCGIVASVENPRGRRHGHEARALFPRAIEVPAGSVARNGEERPGRPFEAPRNAAIVAHGCRSRRYVELRMDGR